MRAVVYDGGVACRDVPEPKAEDGVVLSVRRAGICGTDLSIASGEYRVKFPIILGHEVFGTVWRAANRSSLVGSRCVTEINFGCGKCEFCRAGFRSHCVKGEALGIHRDGGFAEFVATTLDNLHVVPDSISDEVAVFIEPLAACIQITKMAKIEPGSTCAVVGPGRMGLLVIQLLKRLHPGRLVAIGRRGAKLEMAHRLGAETIDVSEVESILGGAGGTKFDNVVETTGETGGLEEALKIVKPRGTIHLKSTHGLPATFDVTKVVVDEIRVQGSRCGPFDEAIGLLDSGEVKPRELITHMFPLERCEEAFRVAASKDAIKTLFQV